jgi:hypothetical protein
MTNVGLDRPCTTTRYTMVSIARRQAYREFVNTLEGEA